MAAQRREPLGQVPSTIGTVDGVGHQRGPTVVPTRTADNGIADKLGIPTAYLRRTREQNIALYDDNVNGALPVLECEGSAVQQRSDAVVDQVAEAQGVAPQRFEAAVDGLGRAVRGRWSK